MMWLQQKLASIFGSMSDSDAGFNPAGRPVSSIHILPMARKGGKAFRKTRNDKLDPTHQFILSDKSIRMQLIYNDRSFTIDTDYLLGTEEGIALYLVGRVIDDNDEPSLSVLTFRLDKIKGIKYAESILPDMDQFIELFISA